jgi:hypothetical protein
MKTVIKEKWVHGKDNPKDENGVELDFKETADDVLWSFTNDLDLFNYAKSDSRLAIHSTPRAQTCRRLREMGFKWKPIANYFGISVSGAVLISRD